MASTKAVSKIEEVKETKGPKFTKKPNHDEFLKGKLKDVIDDPKKSYHDILMYIQNEISESTRVISFQYRINCFKEDGAFAMSRAIEEINGFSTQKREFSPSGEEVPVMVDVCFADGSRQKVPFGQINLPSFGDQAYIEMAYSDEKQIMLVMGQCEKRYVQLMDKIIAEAERILSIDSIYKGKAIKISNPGNSPEFIDLSNIASTPLFLTKEAAFSTEPIEARIEHPETCQRAGMDLKFGVILEGNYGTGKTLYAFKLALKAIQNNWTFIYCPKPENVLYTMNVANMLSKNGQGVVIFIEDVDKILNQRTAATNEISLLMDGGESKNKNIITILTTNHIKDINPTFLRGKRIGSIVSLGSPDKDTAQRMIEAHLKDEKGNSLLAEDCGAAAAEIEKNNIVPAFIAEILDRVKSHRIYSGKEKVDCEDIITSIKSYKKQMEIATVKDTPPSPAETLVTTLKTILNSEESEKKILKGVEEIMKEKGF